MKKNKPQELMLHFMLKETSCDTLTKMMIGYVLHMPMNEPMFQEKLQCVTEFLEECIPAHPGAFSAYFKILDRFPATVTKKIPAALLGFIEENKAEIEKYYGETLPSRYTPSKIIQQDKTIVGIDGAPLTNFEEGQPFKLNLV